MLKCIEHGKANIFQSYESSLHQELNSLLYNFIIFNSTVPLLQASWIVVESDINRLRKGNKQCLRQKVTGRKMESGRENEKRVSSCSDFMNST